MFKSRLISAHGLLDNEKKKKDNKTCGPFEQIKKFNN